MPTANNTNQKKKITQKQAQTTTDQVLMQDEKRQQLSQLLETLLASPLKPFRENLEVLATTANKTERELKNIPADLKNFLEDDFTSIQTDLKSYEKMLIQLGDLCDKFFHKDFPEQIQLLKLDIELLQSKIDRITEKSATKTDTQRISEEVVSLHKMQTELLDVFVNDNARLDRALVKQNKRQIIWFTVVLLAILALGLQGYYL
jgi:hypothetical protein